ncbi:hypothetical protein BD414DRAFT_497082 [Trametes punicea]|nr:hypothetical protein BD414DRAFT_497082 [Trametes punicea]
MMVINWKTGVVVWHMHGSSDQHFKIVSSTHLVLIDGRDLTLRLYAFDSSASVDSPLATAEDCLYVLGLPACADWVSDKYINSAFEPVAKHALGEKPLFTHDTASALLVLQIYLMFPGPEADSESECSSCDDGPASEQFLLVIPVRTLLQFSTDAETTAARLPQASVISWEDWGPRGTRMLALRPYARAPTVLGARVALKDWSEYPGACVVTLYEVHELADRSSPASATSGDQLHQPPDASAVDHVDAAANAGAVPVARDDDWLRDTVTWKNAVHTTYPCRKTTRFIPLDESKNEGSWSSVVRLTHDGLLLIVQCRN